MPINNLFIINTKFHLLLAQSLIQQCDLPPAILISTDKKLSSDRYLYDSKLWSEVLFIEKINVKSFNSIVNFFTNVKQLKNTNIINLFWGNDFQLENQIIAKHLNINSIALFDDGIASYIKTPKQKPFIKNISDIIIFTLLNKFIKNTKAIGHYPHNTKYSLYPQLAAKNTLINPKIEKIFLTVPDALKKQVQQILQPFNTSYNLCFLLTQPISEYKIMPYHQENELLKRLTHHIPNSFNSLIIKAHPSEDKQRHIERINIIKKNFNGNIYFSDELNQIPIEAFCDHKANYTFVSLYSSALINLKVMNMKNQCFSGICKCDSKKLNSLDEIMDMFKKFKIKSLCK